MTRDPLVADTRSRAPAHRLWLRHRVRGRVLLLLCALYAISYVDRTAISAAGPSLRADLHLSETQFGLALAAYSLPYALLQVFGGWIGDRTGPSQGARRPWPWPLGGVSTIWTGLATGLLASLGAARLLLGAERGRGLPDRDPGAMSSWLPGDRCAARPRAWSTRPPGSAPRSPR